jgi:plasmid stabilization system protein ParE
MKAYYKIILEKSAQSDIREAIRYYNSISPRLGSRFYSDLKDRLQVLSVNPHIFQIKYRDVKACELKIFPFLIHYQVNSNSQAIHILAVIHTSRNPKNWP